MSAVPLPDVAQRWRDSGRLETYRDARIFVVDHGATQAGTAVVFLHGFPSSSLDWRQVIEQLGAGRCLALDFPGFGFSDKPAGLGYSLVDQAERLLVVLADHGINKAALVAHDLGTSVACELLARRERGLLPVDLAGVLLINGSVYIEQARLTPSQRLLLSPLARFYTRLSSQRMFRWQFGRILARPVPDEEIAAIWALMNYNDGIRRLPETIEYVKERYRFYRRWTEPLTRLDLPVDIVWGRRDPVAVAAIGQRLADTIPDARLTWLDDLGHYPQLEDPPAVTAAIAAFLERIGWL